jgi:ABC-type nitrate/sulfonate/bicarbonate transport system substrate-binding protein
MRRLICLLVLLGCALTGCGTGDPSAPQGQDVNLVLDFAPNAIHAGIYSAVARGFDSGEGINLVVRAPSATADGIKLLQTGQADFALLDIHDLALARERGIDLVGVMAIVQRPLAAVIAAPGIRSPRQLAGRTVGITGVPSDSAVLGSVVSGAGGRRNAVRTVNIGFNAVPALLSGKVTAATAFWNDEGVQISRRRRGFRVFRVDDYGAPAYPELLLCATRQTVEQNAGEVRAVVRTLVRGYGITLTDPSASLADLSAQVPGIDQGLAAAELNAEEPAFLGSAGNFGQLSLPRLRAWAGWERREGIVRRPIDVTRMFDPAFLTGTASLIGQ